MAEDRIGAQLAEAEQNVLHGKRRVEDQKTLIADLHRDGHDIGLALILLGTFEVTLAHMVAHHARLLRELSVPVSPARS